MLTLKAQSLEGEIESAGDEARQAPDDPGSPSWRRQRRSTRAEAKQDLADLAELAHSKKYDVQIDVDQEGQRQACRRRSWRRVRQKLLLEGFQSSLPALRGFTDEMGLACRQAAGVAGQGPW